MESEVGLPSVFEVSFFHPSTGKVVEIYSALSATEMCCWKLNEGMTCLITTGISPISYIPNTEENALALEKVRNESEDMFKKMRNEGKNGI